jgi:hypothetical protein
MPSHIGSRRTMRRLTLTLLAMSIAAALPVLAEAAGAGVGHAGGGGHGGGVGHAGGIGHLGGIGHTAGGYHNGGFHSGLRTGGLPTTNGLGSGCVLPLHHTTC